MFQEKAKMSFVCVCAGVTDRDIRKEIAAGILTLDALSEKTKAGLGCGRCRETLEDMLSNVSDVQEGEQGRR